MKATLSTVIVNDHLDRLYCLVPLNSRSETYVHVYEEGLPASEVDRIIIIDRRGTKVTTVSMTESSLIELIDDLAYQVEFREYEHDRAFVGACKRALVQLRKITGTKVS
jgi:hypothetical protein